MRQAQDAVVGAPVPSLVPRGCTPDADLVYRTLITFGPATGGELGRELGLPARRITAALDELASFGAVSRRPARSRMVVAWMAAPVADVLAALRGRRLAVTPRTAMDLLVRGAGARHLPSRALTRARLAELNAAARHEHMAMHPEPAFDAEALRSAKRMDRMLLRRGVRMRALGVGPAGTDQQTSYGRRPTEPMLEYRSGSSMPMKLIIVDRRVALFPVEPDDLERGYLEVSQPPVVATLVNLFEQHWAAARDPREWMVPQTALSPRERALITLLAQGHTDASAARRMHIGTRSVTTILRGLMDRFGVENRFQLGLVLGALRAAQIPDEE
ncbi:MAG: LuxR family transcriptional regulator [Micromonosporaceae bacterium]|nr:LuxR family transcriptional regulator [Micromonosporaceae bacterium]